MLKYLNMRNVFRCIWFLFHEPKTNLKQFISRKWTNNTIFCTIQRMMAIDTYLVCESSLTFLRLEWLEILPLELAFIHLNLFGFLINLKSRASKLQTQYLFKRSSWWANFRLWNYEKCAGYNENVIFAFRPKFQKWKKVNGFVSSEDASIVCAFAKSSLDKLNRKAPDE